MFDEAKDVTGDGKVEANYSFELESGLDMIGHATTVYYKVVKKAPVVYAAVDQATKVEVTTVGENLSTTAKKLALTAIPATP